MNLRRTRRPSAALVVSMAALLFALGGTAGAVATSAVPLAKRALSADNAKKLGGQTVSQIVSQAGETPGPASSAAGLVTIKTGSWSLAPGDDRDFAIVCDSGQKAIGGGWDDPSGWAYSWDDRPAMDGNSWRMYLAVNPDAPATQTGGLYAVCIR